MPWLIFRAKLCWPNDINPTEVVILLCFSIFNYQNLWYGIARSTVAWWFATYNVEFAAATVESRCSSGELYCGYAEGRGFDSPFRWIRATQHCGSNIINIYFARKQLNWPVGLSKVQCSVSNTTSSRNDLVMKYSYTTMPLKIIVNVVVHWNTVFLEFFSILYVCFFLFSVHVNGQAKLISWLCRRGRRW